LRRFSVKYAAPQKSSRIDFYPFCLASKSDMGFSFFARENNTGYKTGVGIFFIIGVLLKV